MRKGFLRYNLSVILCLQPLFTFSTMLLITRGFFLTGFMAWLFTSGAVLSSQTGAAQVFRPERILRPFTAVFHYQHCLYSHQSFLTDSYLRPIVSIEVLHGPLSLLSGLRVQYSCSHHTHTHRHFVVVPSSRIPITRLPFFTHLSWGHFGVEGLLLSVLEREITIAISLWGQAITTPMADQGESPCVPNFAGHRHLKDL